MIPDILIHSADTIAKLDLSCSHIIVSIRSPGAPLAMLPKSKHCLGVLRQAFYDVEHDLASGSSIRSRPGRPRKRQHSSCDSCPAWSAWCFSVRQASRAALAWLPRSLSICVAMNPRSISTGTCRTRR